MKRSLMRPTAALFPAVLLVAALVGNGSNCNLLFFAYLSMHLLTLCGVDAFRNAATREPGVRRVDKRFSGTFLQMALGLVLEMVVCKVLYNEYTFITRVLPVCLSAWFILIEQLFEERMFALGKTVDGVMLSIISNVLLLAGLLLDASGGLSAPVQGFYTACGAGLGMVISIIASYIIEPMHAFSLVPRNIGFFPKAAVQSLLYPAAAILLFGTGVKVYAGFILWRLSRTVCRRSHDEARPLNLLLVTIPSILSIAALWQPVDALAGVASVAMLCAVAVFCAPGWRIYCGAALVTAANVLLYFRMLPGEWNILPAEWTIPVVCISCIIAVILNTHKAFLRKV